MGVGMATNIIGSEMERWAAILTADAMNEQFANQMKKQNEFRNQGMSLMGQYAPTLSAEQAGKDMAAGSANRQANYKDIQSRSLGLGEGGDAATNAQLGLQGAQRARLGSYGDWQTAQSSRASDFQSGQNRIASRAGGAAQLFPYQMSHAQHGMDWLNMLGEMIKGAGGGSANFGMLDQQQPMAASSTGNVPNMQTLGLNPQYQQQMQQQYGGGSVNQLMYNQAPQSQQYLMNLYGY